MLHWSFGAGAAIVLLLLVALTVLQLDLRERLHAAVLEAELASTVRERRRSEAEEDARSRPVRAYAITATSNNAAQDVRTQGPVKCPGGFRPDGVLTLGGCRRLTLGQRGDADELLDAAAAQRVGHVMLSGVVTRVHAQGTDPGARAIVLCPLDAARAASDGCAAATQGPFAAAQGSEDAAARLAGVDGRAYALAW